MKKYFLITIILVLSSCASDEAYEDLNTNPNAPSAVTDGQLFVSAVNSLTDFIESTNVNVNNFRLYAQYWTQTQYTDESNYEMIEREIPDYMFSELYRDVLGDLQNAADLTDDAVKHAQIEIISVYTWQMLVDAFGDIPYTESLKVDTVLSPKYDDDEAIYTDLIKRAKAALTNLAGSGSGYSADDLIFGGSISSWTKFGNSLLVKLGSRLLDVNPTEAKSLIESHYSDGISSNADNAYMTFEGSPPNTNPLWEDLVQSGRQDFIPADTFVDVINALSDPRADKFFDPTSKIDIDTTAVVNLQYQGGPYGVSTPFNDNSHISQTLYAPDFRGVLMDYAEMSFILAEAANRGYSVGGTAEQHYKNGIEASMLEWGVSTSDADAYIAHADVAFATAPGTNKEKIAKQFWISMYNRGFEGWTLYRLFDAPVLPNSGEANLPVPKRYTYPQSEQTINGTNVKAANGGNDTQQTPIFWDN